MTAGAPDLRPTATTDSAAPIETGPDHQLEHQMRGTITAGGQAYTATLRVRRAEPEPEQASGIGDIHCTIPAGEPLAKVLPAGGPLLGQGKCWSCGYGPEEARHDPFRTCRICGYHPTL